jgi:hypothetical protein
MNTKELDRIAQRIANYIPNIKLLSISLIHHIVEEREGITLSINDFKELIRIMTGYDLEPVLIKNQLELNNIIVT